MGEITGDRFEAGVFFSALGPLIVERFLGVWGDGPRIAAKAAALAPRLGRSEDDARAEPEGSAEAFLTIE